MADEGAGVGEVAGALASQAATYSAALMGSLGRQAAAAAQQAAQELAGLAVQVEQQAQVIETQRDEIQRLSERLAELITGPKGDGG